MKYIKFPCGCSFKSLDGKIHFDCDWDNLNYECPATWELISSGNTKGLFQIESNFCQQVVKRAAVKNLEDLSNLIAVVRPGSSQSFMEDGKSLTDHYFLRRAGKEEVTPFHPAIEPYLRNTEQILIFQEQAAKLVVGIAGFTPSEADDLRKAAAKKRADLMAPLKVKFLDGCKKVGLVEEKEAERIWSWLEASQRYCFNQSHSMSYAYVTYATAYLKLHFTLHFFRNWLKYARKKPDKQEEIAALYVNAKRMQFDICGPDFRLLNKFFVIHNDSIYFGLSDIKNVGDSAFETLIKEQAKISEIIGPVKNWSYLDLQFRLLPAIRKDAAVALICSGAFDFICAKRTQTKYEFECLSNLTDTTRPWLLENYKRFESVEAAIFSLLNEYKFRSPASKKKVSGVLTSLQKPPHKLDDTAEYLAGEEKRLLGVSITCSPVDSCNIESANCTCQEYLQGQDGFLMIPVFVENVKEVTIKKGKNEGKKMAFLSVSDSTCSVKDLAIFADTWTKYRGVLTRGNTVMIGGKRSDFKERNLIVEKVWQI